MKIYNDYIYFNFLYQTKIGSNTHFFCFLFCVLFITFRQFFDVVIPHFVLGECLFCAFIAVQLGPPSMLDRPFACLFLEFTFQLDVFVGPMEPTWWRNDFVFLLVFHYGMNYIYLKGISIFFLNKIEIQNIVKIF
jgi:hypothetical protein